MRLSFPSNLLNMWALNGTGSAPPSCMFFSGSDYPSHFPSDADARTHNSLKSLVFRLAFSCFQKPAKMENNKSEMGFAWSWSDSAGKRQNVRLCAGGGLPGCLPASSSSTAACQYVRCYGNRERTHTSTVHRKTLSCSCLKCSLKLCCSTRQSVAHAQL